MPFVQGSTQLEFQSIIKSYLDRNYTTSYTNYHPVWNAGPGNSFNLHMRIRIPPNQVVWYRWVSCYDEIEDKAEDRHVCNANTLDVHHFTDLVAC